MDATTNDLTVGQAVFCIAENGDEFVGRIWFSSLDRNDGQYEVGAMAMSCNVVISPGNVFPISEGDFLKASWRIYNSRHVMPDP
jgi:hypothetical protein